MEENKSTVTEETVESPETEAPKKKKSEKAKKPSCDELLEKIAKLEEEIKEKDDKYLRMAAEYDNFRRKGRQGLSQEYPRYRHHDHWQYPMTEGYDTLDNGSGNRHNRLSCGIPDHRP